MKLKNRIAVVAGGSRGAGRGIALALGDAGATVYVAGRTVRGGPKPADGAVGTIEDTAEEVDARGGRGIPVRTDCTVDDDVRALFARVREEHGHVDVLANAVWGSADAFGSGEAAMSAWGQPFWKSPAGEWQGMMTAGPGAYWLASLHAARLMVERGRGLIVGVTDGIMLAEGQEPPLATAGGEYGGMLLWDVAHQTINRLLYGMAQDARKSGIAVITLMPGFMRTERVQQYLKTEAQRKRMGYDKSESPEYLGRAVAALAGDAKVLQKTGRILMVADLAREYGFTDVDGSQPPRFYPFG